MQSLYIIRGPIGSGKSTLAAAIAMGLRTVDIEAVVCENDDYFIDAGVYKFDQTRVHESRRACTDKAIRALDDGKTAIVSNCFVHPSHHAEIETYAHVRGIPVQIVICQGDFQNVHGVEQQRVQASREFFVYTTNRN